MQPLSEISISGIRIIEGFDGLFEIYGISGAPSYVTWQEES
jgi:hypothetical protein